MRCSCFFSVFVADRLTGCPSDALIPPRIVHKTRQGFIRTMSASMSSTPQQRLTYEEISQMNQRKDELKGLHQAYLDTHPEISRMLSDFMSSILLDKPDDVFLFASEHFGTFEGENGGHRPIVISGPSGVGKSTLVGMLIKSFPDAFGFCVSHTTRDPREGEVDGVNYHFTTEDEFQKVVDEGKFLEHATVHGNLYGTSIQAVNEVRKSGKLCLLDIDINGVKLVKETKIAPRYLFVTPPSIGELESRLSGRGTETEENLAIRLKNATVEIKYGTAVGNFHKVITNDDVEETYDELKDTLVDWFPHLSAMEKEED